MRRATLIFCIVCGLGSASNLQAQNTSISALEVNIASTLHWDDGCLRGSLYISNRSTRPLFLTKMGPYYDMALDVSKDEPQNGTSVAWVNVAGVSDIVFVDVDTLPPNSDTQRDFCLRPSVWVVNLSLKTRREIPLRGKLRVGVTYFSSKEDFESYKETWNKPEQRKDTRLWSETYADIPCPPNTCKSDCNQSPIGVHGEARLVPDGGGPPDWNTRGEHLSADLARKVPPCGKKHSIP